MSKPKPIVFFDERLGQLKVGHTTVLTKVQGHPVLNDIAMVRTSTVVDIRKDGNTIETLNTIYVKMEG